MIISIFSISRPFPIYFFLKWSRNGIFWFSKFFLLFFWNFLLRVGLDKTKQLFFFSLFLCLFEPVLACSEAIMVCFNFLNFFAIFLEFSITLRVGTERNDNFYFLSFPAFSNLFLAWHEAITLFFNFFNFFLEFSITCRVGMEWNDNFYFLSFSAFSNLFWLEMKP